jgi:hypothetical protein
MALELIDVGATANDGQGDPIRTAFEKCNINFTQLFSTAGITGLANGSSNIQIPQANGNVNFSVGGTSNVLIITSSAANVFGNFGINGISYLSNVEISGAIVSQGTIQTFADVTANVVTGQYTVNGGNAFIGNLTTTTDLQVLGNVNNNLNVVGNVTAASLSATGNVTGQYILGDGGFLSNVTVVSNVAVTQIANGLTNFAVVATNGNLTGTVNGSSILVLSSGGADVTGTLSVTGNAAVNNLSTGIISSSGNITSSANITGGNLIGTLVGSVTGATTVSASGNITGGNVLFGAGIVSGTGNITGGNVLFGAGIVSGTGNITSGNISTVELFASGDINAFNLLTGGDVISSGSITASGNIQGQNLITSGIIQSTGNLSAGNIGTAGLVSAGGNITAGNLISSGNINGANVNATNLSLSGNVLGNLIANGYIYAAGNISTGSNLIVQSGYISSSGNITGGNLIGTLVGSVTGATTVSASGNITGGNAALGNLVTAAYFQGDGSLLTNLVTGSQLLNGTSNIVVALNGNITFGVSGTASVLRAIPTGIIVSGTASASGNITGGNLIGTLVGSVTGATTVSASGTVTGGNLSTPGILTVNSGGAATAIVNGGSNAVGNIGSATTYFNRIFAQATTALYADLAELYAGDSDYEPGTVISFGGSKEVTISTQPGDIRIAGIVSTNPSYEMNSGLIAEHPIKVALQGRVPTKVTGSVQKGDMMVSAGNGYACSCATPTFGSVLGKSLENFDGVQGVIEIVVGRM